VLLDVKFWLCTIKVKKLEKIKIFNFIYKKRVKMGSANSVCNFGVNDKNQYDADFSEEYEQYGQVKKLGVKINIILYFSKFHI
jgi:hypothetical protein